MIPLALALALAAGPAGANAPPSLRATPPEALPHGGETRCAACHTASDWKDVRFAHERTGFPLEGRHVLVACKSCHPVGFTAPVKGACGFCHRDPHAGELGVRCVACHDASSWKSAFTADAHRRTNFPLAGRHAFIPCEECHGDRRDRSFARITVDCYACHQADYARAAVVAIDHVVAGFGTQCRQCHSPYRFSGAFFPAHDICFLLSSGPHAGIPCLACHTALTGASVTGACNTGTASCTRCHLPAAMAPVHQNVLGYQPQDRKCYECHRFSTAAGPLSSPAQRRQR